jgi:hypothetical protein
MFIKKLEKEIRFCINYRLFNTIIKKDCYLILLIKKTIINIIIIIVSYAYQLNAIKNYLLLG